MNILITADPEIPVPPIHYGGVERIVDMLLKGLLEQGHNIILMAHTSSKVDCRLIPFVGKSSLSKWDTIQNIRQVYKVIKENNFDVVHSFARLVYTLPALIKKIPVVMSYQREPSLRGIKLAHHLSAECSLAFTGCSEYIAGQIRPIAPSFCIYNGCPLNLYNVTYEVPIDAPMVFLGRIEYIKGAHIAIEVAIRTGRRLIIAGNIPPEDEARFYFEQRIQPYLDGNQVQYVGPVNDTQKNQLLGQASCFLMPILWNEPFGIVMAEAMACGTPVIGFARGSVPEVVQHGIDGFICSSVDEMIEYVSEIHSIQRKSVRSSFEERFSSNVIVNQYIELYKSCKK